MDANPATSSITLHYHSSVLESAESLAEVAAALGLAAVGIESDEVEMLFKVLGVSPEGIREVFGAGIGRGIAIAFAIFAAGFLVGRRLG